MWHRLRERLWGPPDRNKIQRSQIWFACLLLALGFLISALEFSSSRTVPPSAIINILIGGTILLQSSAELWPTEYVTAARIQRVSAFMLSLIDLVFSIAYFWSAVIRP